jgi:type IV pilus assembly protein PilY1
VVDGDLDYTTDVIYIGSNIAGTPTGGKVYRVNTNGDLNPANWQMSTLINQGQPLLVGPSVTLDQYNSHWVLFGTGRFWSVADKTTKDQQTIYGIKDACWKENSSTNACSTTYTLADLKNTSTFAVCTNAAGGAIYDSSTGSCNSGTVAYSSYGALQTDIALNYKGWYMNLATGGVPSERVLSKSVVVGGIALVTTFTPNADPCAVQGNSNLYALYFLTGTAYNKPVVGVTGAGSSETVAKSISLGKGLPTTVGVAIGKSTKGFVQTSTGAIVEVNADPAYNVRSGPSSWREKGSGTSGVEQIYKHIVK